MGILKLILKEGVKNMKKKKIISIFAIIAILVVIIGGGTLDTP